MENIIIDIIGQTLGIVATVITFLSYQVNTKKAILILLSLATVSMCISYLLLGAMSGFALNIVCLVRNIVFYFQKKGSRFYLPSAILITAAMIFMGALSWQGAVSLLPIVALAANTVFISIGKPQLLRKSLLATCTLMIIYNVIVFSIGGIMNEAVAIVSAIIGILRYKNDKDSENEKQTEEEVG